MGEPAGVAARGAVVVELARWRAPGEVLRLRGSSGEIGPAGGPLAFRFYLTPQLADDLWYFRRTYAPFRLRWGAGELTFRGEGAAPAGGAERRALAEWSRAVAAEMAGEGSERSFGLVFAWHGGGAVPCEDVSVSLAGTVWAESCPWGGPVRARLDPTQLPRLYSWFDALAPFQETPGGESGDPGQTSRLVFAGRGRRAASPAERQEIEGFGHALALELRVRRPLAAGVAPAEPVNSAFLLPAELGRGGRPTAIFLTAPAEPPAPPLRVGPPAGGGGEEPAPEEGAGGPEPPPVPPGP